jgi:hypothetical protein
MKRACCLISLLLAGLLSACAKQPSVVEDTRAVEIRREVTEIDGEPQGIVREVTAVIAEREEVILSPGDPVASLVDMPMSDLPLSLRQPQRLIIKNADMAVTVSDTDRAVDGAVQVAVDYGGYVISQRVWDDANGYRYGTLLMAVRVDQFEAAMRALRTLGQVTNESASGQDVTDEYVDLNSRLGNLLATQDRLRTFLEEAQNITETLRVHEELIWVEEEIGIIQGRMNYLQDRAAYSTIRINLDPFIPTPRPSPTPSPTPTSTPAPTPTPTPRPDWRPDETAKVALGQLQDSSQSTANFFIYYGIVCGPWLFLLALLALFGWRVYLASERPSLPRPATEEKV